MSTVSLSGSVFFRHLVDEYQTPSKHISFKRELIATTNNKRFRKVKVMAHSLLSDLNSVVYSSIKDQRSMASVIRTLDREFNYLDIRERMEWYADLNFTVEKINQVIEKKIKGYPQKSLIARIKKYYLNTMSSQLNRLNDKFYKLTYPNSFDVDNTDYLQELSEAYKNVPEYKKNKFIALE